MPSPERLTVVWFLCIVLLLVPQQKVVAVDDPLTPILIDSSSTILGSNSTTPVETLAVLSQTSSETAAFPSVLIFSPVSLDPELSAGGDSSSAVGAAATAQPTPILTDWIDAMLVLPAFTPSVDDLASPILPDLDLGPDWGPGTFASGAGVMAMPEPSRGLLLAAGLIGLFNVRRRHPSQSPIQNLLP